MSSERFQITAEDSVQILQFSLPPMLDSMEVDGLIDSVLKQLDSATGKRWIVDLSRTEYLGSSMLGMFVNMREKIRRSGGLLVLCGMSPALTQIFRTCCLERLFTIAKSRADAVAMISRG
jgi:anti-anti-sigma factor